MASLSGGSYAPTASGGEVPAALSRARVDAYAGERLALTGHIRSPSSTAKISS
jgi:hypothetical protein